MTVSRRQTAPLLILVGPVVCIGCNLIFPFVPPPGREAGADVGSLDLGSDSDNRTQDASIHSDVASSPWCKVGWAYRKPLAIQTVGKDLTDFPVLVDLADQDLTAHARADGHDIAFCTPQGTPLSYEREAFSRDEGRLIAWVKVPKLRSSGTVLHLYYGNSTASDQQDATEVWTNSYLGVWHFHTPPPTLQDSTAGQHHGVAYGQMSAGSQVPGPVGTAWRFDGVNDKVVADHPVLKVSGALTVSAWFRFDPQDTDFGDDELVSTQGNAGDRGWDLSFDDDATYPPDCRAISFRASFDGDKYGTTTGWQKICAPPQTWYNVVGVFKPSSYTRFFFDGTMTDEKTQSIAPSLHVSKMPFTIGAESYGLDRNHFMGEIDEVRVSNVPREPEWIAAAYANQSSPGTFITSGLQQQP